MPASSTLSANRTWLSQADCDLDAFAAVVSATTDSADYPHAGEIASGVVVYDAAELRATIANPRGRADVQAELVMALTDGPGIVVFKNAYDDAALVDRATEAFHALIAEQHASGASSGDHFAKPGANDRVWNALEKLAVSDPETFVAYYANDILNLVSVAWLGPGYQVTSQINVVNPGGAAQTGHRDYHLGFMSEPQAAAFPAHVHRLSPALTLQGAVAHSDMPVESGPTMYLPHSHKYEAGYLAYHRPEFQDFFVEQHVQLPLAKGDAAFFNPAVIHGAGHNRSTDIRRMANLLQVSSAFGRAMEAVDRTRIALAVFDALKALKAHGASEAAIHNAIAASAEGYAFPTNLDLDQPVDGMSPPTAADIVARAVADGWEGAMLSDRLSEYADRRRTD